MEKISDQGMDATRHAIATYVCPYCSKHFTTRVYRVTNGETRSCGCFKYVLQQITYRENNKVRDGYPRSVTSTHTFKQWVKLCENPHDVKQEWVESFYIFKEDMWEAPSELWVIHKKDPSLPHSATNSIWERTA